jgi:hypothetical protein
MTTTQPTSTPPTRTDVIALGNAFYEAVAAGNDGRPEYRAWLAAWDAHAEAAATYAEHKQREYDTTKRRYDHLFQEARRLNALAERVGGQISSVDGSFTYTAARHQQDEAQWRADLATYTGKPVAEDTAVNVNAVPLPPYGPAVPYFDRNAGPGAYTDELNRALDASVRG